MAVGLTADFSKVAPPPSGATMTQVISPNLNTSCLVDVSMNVGVGAAAQAKAGIAAGAEMGARTLATGVANIMKVKAEISECAKANGVGAQDAYPDMKMAPDSVGQLIAGAAGAKLGAAMGQGTVAQLANGMLSGSSGLGLAEDVSKGMKGKPPEEIKAAIRETAIANSPANYTGLSSAIIQDASAAPQLAQPLSCDYEALLAADDGALEKIMACDGTNLQHFPELQAIQDNLIACDAKMGELTQLAAFGAGQVDAMDTSSLSAQAALIDACSFCVDKDDQMMASNMAISAGVDAPADPKFDREAEFQAYLNEQKITHAVPFGRVA